MICKASKSRLARRQTWDRAVGKTQGLNFEAKILIDSSRNYTRTHIHKHRHKNNNNINADWVELTAFIPCYLDRWKYVLIFWAVLDTFTTGDDGRMMKESRYCFTLSLYILTEGRKWQFLTLSRNFCTDCSRISPPQFTLLNTWRQYCRRFDKVIFSIATGETHSKLWWFNHRDSHELPPTNHVISLQYFPPPWDPNFSRFHQPAS